MTPGELVGERLRALRELRGLSQQGVGAQLGDLLGKPWTRQAVSNLEKGRRAVTATEIFALAAVLEVSPADLLTGEPGSTVTMPGGPEVAAGIRAGAELGGVAHGLILHGRTVLEKLEGAALSARRIDQLAQEVRRYASEEES